MSHNYNYQIQPVVQRFVLDQSVVNELKSLTPNFGYNGLGEMVFRRTYSRNNEDWADVVIRVIQGVLSIRKEHYYKNGLEWNDEKYQDFARGMALSMFDMKWLPPGRGLWMMGTDFVYNRGGMALANCFRRDTKFHTQDGVKSFNDFSDNDQVIIKGRYDWLPATVKCFGQQELYKLTVKNRESEYDIYTTPNHRWIARSCAAGIYSAYRVKTTNELMIGHELLSMHTCSDLRVVSIVPTGIVEDVWCVQEPKYEEFVLECGILTKNCAAVDTTHDLVAAAEWAMDCLMNGVGVGFSTFWQGTASMPNKQDTEFFVIPDSREGWVHSLIKLLCAYIDSPRYGKNKFPVFDYTQIRPSGQPIKGFGGVASGSEPLINMHKRIEKFMDNFCSGNIETKKTEKKRKRCTKCDDEQEYEQVTSIDRKPYSRSRLVADIFNAIGVCVVAGNVRRCISKGALVHTKQGLIEIENVKVGQEVLVARGEYKKVTNVFEQGKQDLVRIVTEDGYFRCTPNHRMAVATGYGGKYIWKQASELVNGDRLISSRVAIEGKETELPEWNFESKSSRCRNITPPPLDADMAWFIGVLHGNGYVGANREKNGFNACVEVTNASNKYSISEKVQEQMQLFGDNLHVPISSAGKNRDAHRVRCQSKQLAWYLDENFKQPKTPIKVPECILRGTTEIRLAYLAGICDSDGCMKSKHREIISTIYPKFAKQIQTLLYSCGIESKLSEEICQTHADKGWKPTYSVNLTTIRSQRMFSEIPQLMSANETFVKRKNINCFPGSISIDTYDEENDSWFCPVKVLEVVPDQCEETYDIEVEEAHEFFCDGYLTHNSAEICLGDPKDRDFVNLKNYEKNPERAEIGWTSNNSAILTSDNDFEDFSYIPDIAKCIVDNGKRLP